MSISNVDKVWFTSDHHFGHENIIKFTGRPFSNVQEMDRYLIERWNDTVPSDGIVFHLGDVTLGDVAQARKYLSSLNGRIHILGNEWHHDRRWLAERWRLHISEDPTSLPGIRIRDPLLVLEVPKIPMNSKGFPLAITLCHYPIAAWDRAHHGAWHLHGHSHGKCQYPDNQFALDVGVDAVEGYRPIGLSEVMDLMIKKGWSND